MSIFRWIAIVPAAIFGASVAWFVGMVLQSITGSLCPGWQTDAGTCVAWWFFYAESTIIIFTTALATALAIIFAAALAPEKHYFVANLIFIAGLVIAGMAALNSAAWLEFATVAVAGFFTAQHVHRKYSCK